MSEANVCCICLKEFSCLESVDKKDEQQVKHCDKLRTCFPNEVWYSVYTICEHCIKNLEAAYQFFLMCLKNEFNRRKKFKTRCGPYHCNDCKKSFKLETRLKKHISSCHPIPKLKQTTNGRCKNECEVNSKFESGTSGDADPDLSDETKDSVDVTCDKIKDNKSDVNVEDHLKLEENIGGGIDLDTVKCSDIEIVDDDYKQEINEDSDQNFDNSFLKSASSSSEEEFKPASPKKGKTKVLRKKRTPKSRSIKESFTCEYCTEIFRTEKYLRKHTITKHTFERPYKCDQCDATYRGKDMLVIHKRKHTGETPFVCSVCGKAFKSSHGLFVHNQTHATDNRYGCPNCDKGFKTLGNLRKHLICVHTKSEDYKYQCNQCGHKFPFKGHLEKHLIRHTGIKNFPCRICGKMFILKTDAELHIRRTHTNDQLSSCEVCYKEFKSTEGLQKHLKTAHNIGNYKVQVHVKKLLCPYCPKMFPYNNKLQRHILTHTGEKPFKCNICTKGFRDRTDLKTHLKNSHQVIDTFV